MKTSIYAIFVILVFFTTAPARTAEPTNSAASNKKTAAKPAPKDQLLFNAYDQNRDKKLSEREFKKAPLIREADRDLVEDAFKSIDIDRDDALSLKEYLIGQPALKLLFRASSAVMDDGSSASSNKEIKRILRDARS